MRAPAPAARRQAGLTLIELMVTVLLATLLIGGLFYMMVGQQKTYNAQVNTLSAQENLWGAMEFLERQIRMAGYGFGSCGGKLRKVGTGDGGVDTIYAMEFHNNSNLFKGGAADGTDSFEVRYSTSVDTGIQGVRLTKEMPINASSMFVSAATGLQNGDLIVVCMPGYPGTIMQLTQAPNLTGNEWKLNMNPSSPYNPSNWNNLFGPGAKYPMNTLVSKFGTSDTSMKFAIDNTVNPPRLVTWQVAATGPSSDLQIVAMGIEDMQISWACDTEATGNKIFTEGICDNGGSGVTCNCARSGHNCTAKQTDEWANNVAGDTLPQCGSNPIQRVRITLIARTDAPVIADMKGFRPTAEDHYEGTVADDLNATDQVGTYARAVLSSVVVPRNVKVTQ